MDLQWANSRSNGERPDAPVGAQGTPWVPAAASLQSLALEAAANAIFITDRSGRIIWTNPAFTRLTSYTAGEALGQNPRILKSGLHDPAYYAALWRTIGDGRVWHSEVTNRRKDGSFYIAEQTITPVREADGRITHFISISQDISQRRQAMEAQRRLTAIIEATTDFVATATVDGQLLYVNGAGRSMLGLAADVPLTGRTLFELHPPWAREIIEREAIPVAVRSGSWNGETALVGPGGSEILVWQVVLAHHSADGRMEYLSTLARDITERKRAEETLRQTEKVAAMGQLLAGVAHELNNPLAAVLAHAQLLTRDTDSAHRPRAVKILNAAERCVRIVRNFLALARQEPTQQHRVLLESVVHEALELLAYPLRVDNVNVELRLDPEIPVLSADAHQLHQVLVNLITNAHQAMRETPPSERRITITTGTEAGGQRVALEVTDTGPGIPAALRPRIFEPFFTTKPPGEGTGLGLPLCLRVVENHGGTITVQTATGRGTTFRIVLPVTGDPAHAPAAGAAHRTGAHSGRALVVDDEPDVADVLTEFLAADGHHVETVSSGSAALAQIAGTSYDFVVCDLKMPDGDGVSLYRELAQQHHPLCSRFIVATGDILGPETAAFLAETRVPCIGKPFNRDELRSVIQALLSP